MIESGLSFLGIGVPDDVVTWGSLLNLGRQNLEAWWLILYPGIAIFITITIYNMIAEASRDQDVSSESVKISRFQTFSACFLRTNV